MKKHFSGLFCVLLIISVVTISWKPAALKTKLKGSFSPRELLNMYVDNIYQSAHLEESGLEFDIFKKALTGFIDIKAENKIAPNSNILTVIDYTKESCEKRMWIIDVVNKELILNTWVAHGHGSGDNLATQFSDKMDSHKSSLGFYLTNEVYYGDNGRSLRLDGLDAGFNKNARSREIVMHGAAYVSQNTIDQMGRLGRSWGCPAVMPELADQIIDVIKDKTVLFIHGNSNHYSSKYLDEELAASFMAQNPDNTALTASL